MFGICLLGVPAQIIGIQTRSCARRRAFRVARQLAAIAHTTSFMTILFYRIYLTDYARKRYI